MRIAWSVLLIISGFASLQPAHAAGRPAVGICEVLANQDAHLGKHVTLRSGYHYDGKYIELGDQDCGESGTALLELHGTGQDKTRAAFAQHLLDECNRQLREFKRIVCSAAGTVIVAGRLVREEEREYGGEETLYLDAEKVGSFD